MNNGETILALVRNMQKLNGEIAALLKTAEILLSGKGFKNNLGNSVTKDRSSSIDAPSYWTPPYMYRVLENKQDGDDVIVLNVILDNPDKPESIHEPIVCCARFQYEKEQAKKHVGVWDAWELWFSEPPKELKRVYNGEDLKIHSKEFILQTGWDKETVVAMKVISFIALPLANITDSKVLLNNVLERIF